MNKSQKKEMLFKSGNQIMDKKRNIWNVLKVETNLKNRRIHFQLMQLRNGNGNRCFRKTIFAPGARTVRAARNKLAKMVGIRFKRVEYNSLKNELEKVEKI